MTDREGERGGVPGFRKKNKKGGGSSGTGEARQNGTSGN